MDAYAANHPKPPTNPFALEGMLLRGFDASPAPELPPGLRFGSLGPEIIDIDIADLQPTQARGVSGPHLKAMFLDREHSLFSPVLVVPYDHGPDGRPLLIDGTHRTYLQHYLGAPSVKALLATSDEQLATIKSHVLHTVYGGSLETLYEVYETRLAPNLRERGIRTIADLPVHNDPRNSLREVGLQWP